MPKVTLHIARNLFDLGVDPNPNLLSNYFALNDEDRQKFHEEILVKEVEKALAGFGIKASVTVSSVETASGMRLILEDFHIFALDTKNLMAEVRRAVYLHEGIIVELRQIKLTLQSGTVTL